MNYTNLHRILHLFRDIVGYWSIFYADRFDTPVTHLFGETPKPTTTKFGVKNPQTASCHMVKPHFDILDSFGVAHWCDRQTDRQTELRWL